MRACWEQTRLWLSSPLYSCNAVFYCRHRNTPYQQSVCFCRVWMSDFVKHVWGGERIWDASISKVCVLVRVEMFKPICDHTWCVCRRQEVGSIASRCWRQSRNSLNIRSPSFPAPTPKSKYSKFQEIGSGRLRKVSFLSQKHLWWAPHSETDREFQLNPLKPTKGRLIRNKEVKEKQKSERVPLPRVLLELV